MGWCSSGCSRSVGLEYDKDWIDKFIDQSKRNITAEWDDDGNLIT